MAEEIAKSSQNGHAQTSHSKTAGRWIKLNVGGKTFITTRSTILQSNESFLARLIQEDVALDSDKDEQGAFLIDRDPKYFNVVLNYLRHGRLILENNVCLEGVLAEAEFYGIASLIALARKRQEEQKRTSGCPLCGRGGRCVYRVFQCSEEELAPMVSTISDGWKFEQLISTGSSYSYGSADEGGAEFLCVVSRDCSQCGSGQEAADRTADAGGGQDRGVILQQRGSRT